METEEKKALKTILDSYQEIIKAKNAEFAQQFTTKMSEFKQSLFARLQQAAKGATGTFNDADAKLLNELKALSNLFNGKLPNVQKTIDLVLSQFDAWYKLMGLTSILGNPSEKPIVVANLSLSEDSIKKIDNKLEDISKWLAKNEKKTDEKTNAIKAELAITRPNLEAVKTVLRKAIDLDKELRTLSKVLEKLAQNPSDLQKAEALLKAKTELNPELQTLSLTKAEKQLSKTVKNLEIWLQANKNCKFETEADKQQFVQSIQSMNSQIGNCAYISQDPTFSPATQQMAAKYQSILEKSQQEIAQICGSKINITFQTKTQEELGTAGGYCAFTINKNGEPTILIVSKDNAPSTIAHELCHAAQFKRGEIVYILSNGKYSPFNCYDLYDEVEAYKVTYAMLLNEKNATYHLKPEDITPNWVVKHGKNYEKLPNKKLSIDDKISEFPAFASLFAICKRNDSKITAIVEENIPKVHYNGVEIFNKSVHDKMSVRTYLSSTIEGIKIIDVVSSVLKVQL